MKNDGAPIVEQGTPKYTERVLIPNASKRKSRLVTNQRARVNERNLHQLWKQSSLALD